MHVVRLLGERRCRLLPLFPRVQREPAFAVDGASLLKPGFGILDVLRLQTFSGVSSGFPEQDRQGRRAISRALWVPFFEIP